MASAHGVSLCRIHGTGSHLPTSLTDLLFNRCQHYAHTHHLPHMQLPNARHVSLSPAGAEESLARRLARLSAVARHPSPPHPRWAIPTRDPDGPSIRVDLPSPTDRGKRTRIPVVPSGPHPGDDRLLAGPGGPREGREGRHRARFPRRDAGGSQHVPWSRLFVGREQPDAGRRHGRRGNRAERPRGGACASGKGGRGRHGCRPGGF